MNPAAADHTVEVQCQTCGAQLVIPVVRRTARCPYCASSTIVEHAAGADRPTPDFAIAFSLTRDAAKACVRRWAKTQSIFAHGGLRTASLDEMTGLYVPALLYSALARTDYAALIGERYTEIETYWTTDANGRAVQRTRVVTKTDWFPLSGQHATYVTDVLATAARGIPNDELEMIEPFDLRLLRRYESAVVSGWEAEDPTLHRDECMALARQEATNSIARLLPAFMPGDEHQNLQFSTRFERESGALTLLPVWVTAMRYDPRKPPVRVLVNGQTGATTGQAPVSWKRVAIAFSVAAAILMLIVILVARSQ